MLNLFGTEQAFAAWAGAAVPARTVAAMATVTTAALPRIAMGDPSRSAAEPGVLSILFGILPIHDRPRPPRPMGQPTENTAATGGRAG
ncbi:hypothetical protein GCM10010468_52050 [Actinocorallia longicatena]|uniref:Uncharacterized protein n=1 Tax=Actinocorallia longicatena TaxID=111803 RepID=A0ABP6QG09_9ACTN